MDALRPAAVTLIVLSLFGPAAATGVAAQSDTGSASGACFPPGGHEFVIGDGDPGMTIVVHTSVFPDAFGLSNVSTPDAFNETRNATAESQGDEPLEPVSAAAEGALGMEAHGVALGQEVVFMQVGVLFAGVDDPWQFVRNPFSAFSLAFHYRLSLSGIFGGDVIRDYETSESPVRGLKTVTCS